SGSRTTARVAASPEEWPLPAARESKRQSTRGRDRVFGHYAVDCLTHPPPDRRSPRLHWTLHRTCVTVLWHVQRSPTGAVGSASGHARPDDPQDAASSRPTAWVRPRAAD